MIKATRVQQHDRPAGVPVPPPGPPEYTHFRFRVTSSFAFPNGGLMCCTGDGGREVSWNFNTALGTSGYVNADSNLYVVITVLRTHPSFPADLPAINQGIKQGSTHADIAPLGVCSPHFNIGHQDVDSTVDFEECFSDGTRDDDP